MTVPIDLRDILILIGVGNGLLMSMYMLLGRDRSLARSLLGLLIICLSFNVLLFIILKYRVYDNYPVLHWLPFGLSFIIGPLLYFYVQAVISSAFKMTVKQYRHFLLILLDYPHSVYHIIYGRGVAHLDLHYVLDKFSLFSLIPNGIYLFLTFKVIKKYNQELPNYLSNTQRFRLQWLSNSILAWSGLFLVGLVYGAVDFIVDFGFEEAYFINFIFTITIIWLSIKGLSQEQNATDLPKQPPQTLELATSDRIIEKLRKTMGEQKLYLLPDLTLRNIEDQLGFSSKDISMAINQSLKKNFYQYVNEYRVEEFKERAVDPSNSHLTLFGIAQECGFSSKATFNRVFKSGTGLSPKEYLAQQDSNTSQ